MSAHVKKALSRLKGMTVGELREEYEELFGEETGSHNKAYLLKRIAWRIQSLAEGSLSQRAIDIAERIANDADIRMNPPRENNKEDDPVFKVKCTGTADVRLPIPGTVLTRIYKGRKICVLVRKYDFEYEGETYRTLTAVVKKITGSHWNGYGFFNLKKKGNSHAKTQNAV